MISPPSPIIFDINGFAIHYYGLIMFCAIVVALIVIRYISKKYYEDIDTEVILDILPAVLFFSIVGARLYYVLMDFSYYKNHLSEIIAVWHGGMSIHGGILGGVIAGIVMTKIKKISFLKYADVFAYGLVLGQAIGRVGNYFNCEAFGKPCSIPFLKLFIPLEHRPFGYEDFSYFHPTFLYESLWDVFVFLVLFFIIRKFVIAKTLSDGTIFLSYLILYSIGRYFIELCRLDSVRDFFGVPVAEFISVLVIMISVIGLFLLNKKGKID